MYFSRFRQEYLPAIAKLEEKVYPPEMVLGLQDLKNDMEKNELWKYSVVGFKKGELVCYVAAYPISGPKKEKKYIYISDVNCTNPLYLKRLLLYFFSNISTEIMEDIPIKNVIFSAEMRESSYRLLENERKRQQRGVTVWKEKLIPGYYSNGEAVHQVEFTVDDGKCMEGNWKDLVQLRIDRMEDTVGINLLAEAFRALREEGVLLEVELREEKNMRFILGCIREALIDYYAMYSEQIPTKIIQRLRTRSERVYQYGKQAYEKTMETYKNKGFEETKEGDHCFWYDEYHKELVISSIRYGFHTKYRDSLSGIRWVWKREWKFLSEKKNVYYFEHYNRYGVRQLLARVPYLTKVNYLYMAEKMCFIEQMKQELKKISLDDKKCFEDMCNMIYYFLPGIDARACIQSIASKRKEEDENYFHDWNIVLKSFGYAEDILTIGAMKRILMSSYQQAWKQSENIKAVLKVIALGKKIGKPLDIKEVRKTFSSILRQKKDCKGYLDGLSYEMESAYRSKLNLPASQEGKIIAFVEQMKRYSPWITFYNVFQEFGARVLSKFISGTYPYIFKPQEISLSYHVLAVYVEELLQKRTRQAKHLYRKLLKKELLVSVLNHDMTREQCREVLEILKFHNVEIKDPVMKKLDDFKTLVEPKGSPEFLTAGDASVCCMSFGTEKATIYAKEKGFGILNVYYRDRVIANSVIWINKPYQCLVLDNIEVHPNYMKFTEILRDCFRTAAEKLTKQHKLKFAVQGTQYNDLELYGEENREIVFEECKPVEVQTERFYTDAKRSRVIFQNVSDHELPKAAEKKENFEGAVGIAEFEWENDGLGEVLPAA